MQPIPSMGYDRAITVFSPDGRLFQVEYAREAVKRGTTSIGIKCKEGVLLAVDKRIASKLIEGKSVEKIYQIDEHVIAATCGLVADARVLIERARVEAQNYKIIYNEPIDIALLAKRICDFKQLYTQHGGVRPFGVALILAGINEKPRVFETDPSGALIEYKATAVGAGRNAAMEIFEEKYKEEMSMQEIKELAIEALYRSSEEELSVDNIEIATLGIEDKKLRRVKREEIEEILNKVKEKYPKKKE